MLLFQLLTLQMPYKEVPTFKVPDFIIQGVKPEMPTDLGAEYDSLHLGIPRATPQLLPDPERSFSTSTRRLSLKVDVTMEHY